jgi:DNA modification methylase
VKPYYEHGGITIYHGDCREVLSGLSADAVVTDPPYGIAYDGGATQNGTQNLGRIAGDDSPFNPSPLFLFGDVLCWGANNYAQALPRGGQFYVWDKVCQNGMRVRIAECEFAWHWRGSKPRVFRHLWSGAYRASESGQRSQHPTQKPIVLMRWCIEQLPDAPGTILDPFMGSGTTLRAAKDLGRKAIGIEIEERYCEIAAKRMGQEVLPFA